MAHNPADPVNDDVTYIAAELHQPVGGISPICSDIKAEVVKNRTNTVLFLCRPTAPILR